MTDETLKKRNKIRTSREFKKIQKDAKKKHSKYFTILYNKGKCRLGLTVSTKVGNSPQRNYIKRCIREFFRRNKYLFQNLDVVFIAKPEIIELNSLAIQSEIIRVIQKK